MNKSGLSKQDIDYFRQKMAVVKTQIEEIDETIQSYTKLRIISNRYNTTQTMKEYFKSLVKHPEKLPDANLFVHTCVPSLNEMTKAYKELSEQPVKRKRNVSNTTRIRRKNRSRLCNAGRGLLTFPRRQNKKVRSRDGLRKPYNKGVENND